MGDPSAVEPAASGRPRYLLYARALVREPVTLAALLTLIAIGLAALAPTIMAPLDPFDQALRDRLSPPLSRSAEGDLHVFGTDQLGRDLLSRIISASRVSILVGVSSVALSGLIGVGLGLLAGYIRGWVDDLIMRAVDLQMAFPFLLLAIFVLYALGGGMANVIAILAIVRWPVYARVARGMALSLREAPFLDGARSMGCSTRRILGRYMLPNMLSPVLVLATLEFARVVLAESALSFLGLGIQPPDSSWGRMIAEGRQYIGSAWWLIAMPGLAIFATALSANLLATWVRSITDPVNRWRWLRSASSSSEGASDDHVETSP